MTESVVFFRKLAVLNVLAFYLVNVSSPKMCRIVGEPHGQKANIKKSRGSEGHRRYDGYFLCQNTCRIGIRALFVGLGGATWPKLRSNVKGHEKFGIR